MSYNAAMAESEEQQCATYLKALADPLRLQLVRALQTGPLTVSDLTMLLEQEIGTVSHHLRVLYHADLVTTRREGKFIYYSLQDRLMSARRAATKNALDLGCCKLDMGPMTAKTDSQ